MMSNRVETLGADDVSAIVSVLREAFSDYPVMTFILGDEGDYAARLEKLVTFFMMARVLKGEVMLGVREKDTLDAVGLVSYPDGGEEPSAFGALRELTWADLGADTRARYEMFAEATASLGIDAPHIHLNMIGVRKGAQGKGLGKSVLDAVHALSVSDASSTGVSLSTEVEANVALYRSSGYEVVGSADVGSAFTTWAMFRRDQ